MYQKVALTEEEYMDCPTCDKIFSSFKPFRGLTDGDEEDVETESQNHTHCNSQGHGKKRKGRHEAADKGADALGFEPKVKDSTWVDKTDGDSFPLVPSAKMAALKAVLLRGFQEAPTDKVSFLSSCFRRHGSSFDIFWPFGYFYLFLLHSGQLPKILPFFQNP